MPSRCVMRSGRSKGAWLVVVVSLTSALASTTALGQSRAPHEAATGASAKASLRASVATTAARPARVSAMASNARAVAAPSLEADATVTRAGPQFPQLQRYTIPDGPFARGQAYEKRQVKSQAMGIRSKATGVRAAIPKRSTRTMKPEYIEQRTRKFSNRKYYPGERVPEPVIEIVKLKRPDPVQKGAYGYRRGAFVDYDRWFVKNSNPCGRCETKFPLREVGIEPIRSLKDLRERRGVVADWLRRQKVRDEDYLRRIPPRGVGPQRKVEHKGTARPAPMIDRDPPPARERPKGGK